ncbi:class I lanthipeptide [Taibaiella koreensis]|uniref:class I lanthipeptide n=1 Tax=Taibaiella koreensis TaxID=1268548 RepID=UPI0013C30330|nr:class I lanthipeptide [Taibaiella koreensis]
MKQKNGKQKLSLRKTAISRLSTEASGQIKGGVTTFNKGCPTGPQTLHTCASFDRSC